MPPMPEIIIAISIGLWYAVSLKGESELKAIKVTAEKTFVVRSRVIRAMFLLYLYQNPPRLMLT